MQFSNVASLWFLSLLICVFATSILEMRRSGVSVDEWWRNEQFWVIGGVSAHLFAVFEGLLKVLAGVDPNITVTSKAGDDEQFSELYSFRWTTLLIPPTTLLIINLIEVVTGVSNAINNGYESWGNLFSKLFFAFWVIVHLYPFLKGLLGRQNRTPTFSIVWSILLGSVFSLLWGRLNHSWPSQKAHSCRNADWIVTCSFAVTGATVFRVFSKTTMNLFGALRRIQITCFLYVFLYVPVIRYCHVFIKINVF